MSSFDVSQHLASVMSFDWQHLLEERCERNNVAFDLKRSRANLQVEFLTLLLRAAVSHPDALDPSTSDDLAHTAGVTLPQLTGTKSVAPAAAATFLAAYLPLCSNEESRASIWTNSLTSVAHLEELSDQVDAMSELLAASEAVSKTADADKADDSDNITSRSCPSQLPKLVSRSYSWTLCLPSVMAAACPPNCVADLSA